MYKLQICCKPDKKVNLTICFTLKIRIFPLKNFIKATEKISEFAIMAPYIQEKENKNDRNYLKNVSPVQVDNVKGFAMFLNLSEFKDIGFFDEDFFFYFEEIDLCKRLIDKGKKIYLVPSIRVDHDGGQSHPGWPNRIRIWIHA